MSFWATVLLPHLFDERASLDGCPYARDTPRLLAQNIAEAVGVEKRLEASRVRRARFQFVQRTFQRNIAHDARQAPGQIGGFLVGEKPRGQSRGAAQLHAGYAREIGVQLI